MPSDWTFSFIMTTTYKTNFCPQMTASEQQDFSNTLFSYYLPMRPKEPAWMNRKGNWRHNAYLSSLSLFLLPTPLWHPCISSFFPLSRWQKLSDLMTAFTADGLNRSFSNSHAKQNQTLNPPIFSVLIYFLSFLSPQLLLITTDALFVCQFFCKPWKPGFPLF